MLDVKMLEGLLEDIGSKLWYLNVYFQGEPLLHPGFEDIVRSARQHGVYVSTSTNAHHITPDRAERIVTCGLNRIVISIDGADQAAYEQYRIGGRLTQVLAGTQALLEARKRLRRSKGNVRWWWRSGGLQVVWQFLVTGQNEHQLKQIRSMAREAGVDRLEIKTAQIEAPQDGHPLLTQDPALRRYDRVENRDKGPGSERWAIRNPMKDECRRMWEGAVVTWDGRVVPCCFDKDAEHEMGQLNADGRGFFEIWHGEAYRKFRQSIFSNRKGIDICRNCTEGMKSHVS
jgi:radical SAM protein with 4Fe4S-binding SPASM domain